MEREQFRQIVRRIERRAARFPAFYRLAVTFRALFGFFFFYLLLLLALAAIAGGAWTIYQGDAVPLGIILIVAGVYAVCDVGRAIAFRLDAPIGAKVTRKDAPELWQLVDDLRRRTGNPRVRAILLTPDLSAAVVQNPRRGLITGYRNYLVCGLPLMMGLTRDQFAAVIAHELGHLARKHGALGAWVYRLQRVWDRILEQTSQRPKHPLARFIRWYAPRFAAHSYVLRRQQEFEADRISLDLVGREACGDALILSYLRDAQQTTFWEETWRRSATEPSPPVDVLAQMHERLAALPDEATLRRELGESLARRTNEFDTHPSLADRLDRLGYLAHRGIGIDELRGEPTEIARRLPLPAFEGGSAADALLGPSLPRFLASVAESWAVDASEAWDHRHQQLLRDRGRLWLLERKAEAGALSVEETFERSQILESIDGDLPALEVLRSAPLAPSPHAPTLYAHGRLLLRQHDPAGVAMIEEAMRMDPEAVTPGAQLLFDFHSRRNDHAQADLLISRLDAHDREVALARIERDMLRNNEKYQPHQVPPEEVRRIICVLRTLKFVEQAYLVKRACERFPEKPAHALILRIRIPFWRTRPSQLMAALAQELNNRINIRTPLGHFLLDGSSNNAAICKQLKRMPEHRIFDVNERKA